MKDPLQKKPTPYEILGVGENSDKKAIDDSFKQAIGRGQNIKDVTQARTTLSKPMERSLIDLFLYNDAFLAQLEPGGTFDASRLQAQRNGIIEKWVNVQRVNFPFSAATHSIAVSNYWAAIAAEEERIETIAVPPLPPATEFWNHVIANWAFIINSTDFWRDWRASRDSIQVYFTPEQVNQVCQALETHFINLFISLGERFRTAGDQASVKRMQELEILFTTELKTGKRLFKAGLMITKMGRNVPICCGRLFLDKINLLSLIQPQLELIVQANPTNQEFKELLSALSPYFSISVLMEHKKYDDALAAISQLSEEEKKRDDVKRLTAESYLEKGKQEFSVNQLDAAIEAWKKGLKAGFMKKEITEAIVSAIKTKAVQIQPSQPDQAIEMLEKGLKIVNDSTLSANLAEFCNVRGVQLVNEVHNKIEVEKQQCNPQMIATVKKGIALFEKAIKNGHKDASKNLENTKQMLQVMESGAFDLSPEVAELMKSASFYAKNPFGSDEAISILEKALSICKTEKERSIVTSNLAELCNTLGVNYVNGVYNVIEIEKKPANSDMIVPIKKGISLFEKAIKYGHKDAAKNLENSKQMLKALESAGMDLSPQVADLIHKANQSAERSRSFNEGVGYLDKALTLCKTEKERGIVKKLLSQFLNLRAVGIINPIANNVGQMMFKHQESINKDVDNFLDDSSSRGGIGSKIRWFLFFVSVGLIIIYGKQVSAFLVPHTGKFVGNVLWIIVVLAFFLLPPFFRSVNRSMRYSQPPAGYGHRAMCTLCTKDAVYSYNLTGHGTVILCQRHSDQLKIILNRKMTPDSSSKTSLQGAKNDLNRALSYDPGNDQIKQNLNAVNNMLTNM